MRKHISILLFVAFALTLSGCGDGKLRTEPVTGTITYKGEPLVGASVAFSPKVAGEGHGGFARTDSNGFYRLQTTLGHVDAGTTPGEYYVTITKVKLVGTGRFTNDGSGRTEEEVPVSVIPEKYSSAEGGLTATVVRGRNVFNFDLE